MEFIEESENCYYVKMDRKYTVKDAVDEIFKMKKGNFGHIIINMRSDIKIIYYLDERIAIPNKYKDLEVSQINASGHGKLMTYSFKCNDPI